MNIILFSSNFTIYNILKKTNKLIKKTCDLRIGNENFNILKKIYDKQIATLDWLEFDLRRDPIVYSPKINFYERFNLLVINNTELCGPPQLYNYRNYMPLSWIPNDKCLRISDVPKDLMDDKTNLLITILGQNFDNFLKPAGLYQPAYVFYWWEK